MHKRTQKIAIVIMAAIMILGIVASIVAPLTSAINY